MLKRAPKLLLILVLSLGLASCSGVSDLAPMTEPESTVHQFFQALNNDDPNTALDVLCQSMILIELPPDFWHNDTYEELTNDGFEASIRVLADVRIEELETGTILNKKLDFIVITSNSSRGWCLERRSLSNVLASLLDFGY